MRGACWVAFGVQISEFGFDLSDSHHMLKWFDSTVARVKLC